MAGGGEFLKLGLTLTSPAMARTLLNIPAGSLGDAAILGDGAARALAEGVRKLGGADMGLALTGAAGREKTQDHVIHIALAHLQGTECLEQRWPHAMRFIENRMTKMALAQVRKYILDRK
jgi:nicotinamide mononucleotide (NMN) deamidase PncC